MREMRLDMAERIGPRLERLAEPVHLLVFPHPACPPCADLARTLAALGELSPRVRVEIVDLESKPLLAACYGIEMTPAVAILRGGVVIDDTLIRYYGTPDAATLDDLLDDIIGVSRAAAELAVPTAAWLEALAQPIHVHAFVDSRAEMRPEAVRAARRMAIASPLFSADVIAADDYPDLAKSLAATVVPSVVVAGHEVMRGDVSEARLVAAFQASAAGSQSDPRPRPS